MDYRDSTAPNLLGLQHLMIRTSQPLPQEGSDMLGNILKEHAPTWRRKPCHYTHSSSGTIRQQQPPVTGIDREDTCPSHFNGCCRFENILPHTENIKKQSGHSLIQVEAASWQRMLWHQARTLVSSDERYVMIKF
jgi:hypothetical protein